MSGCSQGYKGSKGFWRDSKGLLVSEGFWWDLKELGESQGFVGILRVWENPGFVAIQRVLKDPKSLEGSLGFLRVIRDF